MQNRLPAPIYQGETPSFNAINLFALSAIDAFLSNYQKALSVPLAWPEDTVCGFDCNGPDSVLDFRLSMFEHSQANRSLQPPETTKESTL